MVVNHVLGRFRKRCQRLCRNLGFGLGFQQKASSVIRAALNRGKTRSVLLGAAAIVLVLGLAFHLDAFCLRLSFTMRSLCSKHANMEVHGNVCDKLCEASPHSCSPMHSGKSVVFRTSVGGLKVYVKGNHEASQSEPLLAGKGRYPTVEEFRSMVASYLEDNMGIKVPVDTAFVELFPDDWQVLDSNEPGYQHSLMETMWALVQDAEYVFSAIFGKLELFPKLLGSCGTLYLSEELEPLPSSGFFGGRKGMPFDDFLKRVAVAMAIMDLLDELETVFEEPVFLCDIKPSHFGISDAGKVKFLDLDTIFFHNTLVKAINSSNPEGCSKHSDCDFFDCRGECDLIRGTCRDKVVNNNLQAVCEKVFLASAPKWMTLMVPAVNDLQGSGGLLTSKHSNFKLNQLLEECANPSGSQDNIRLAASDSVKVALYKALSEVMSFGLDSAD